MSRAVVILLYVKPFRCQKQYVFVGRIAFEKVVHGEDCRQEIALFDAGHPADEKLFIRSGVGEKRLGPRNSTYVRSVASSGKRQKRIGKCVLRILLRRVLGVHHGIVEQSALIFVEGEFQGFVGLDGARGNGDRVEEFP